MPQYRRVFFDLNSDNVINQADLDLALPRAPKWTWGGSVSYEAGLGNFGTPDRQRLLPAPRRLCLHRQQLGLQFGLRPARCEAGA